MKFYTFILEKTNTGFSANSEDIDKYPAATTGSTIAEIKSNALEALNLWFEHNGKKQVTEESILIKLDLAQFFEYYNVINIKAFAKRIGMNKDLLSQYVNRIKKPSSKQVGRITKGISDLGAELSTVLVY